MALAGLSPGKRRLCGVVSPTGGGDPLDTCTCKRPVRCSHSTAHSLAGMMLQRTVVDLWPTYRDRIENGLLCVHSFDAGVGHTAIEHEDKKVADNPFLTSAKTLLLPFLFSTLELFQLTSHL
jgi:hypothetical protein